MFPTRATWFITTSLPGRFLAAPEAVPTPPEQVRARTTERNRRRSRASIHGRAACGCVEELADYGCVRRNGCFRGQQRSDEEVDGPAPKWEHETALVLREIDRGQVQLPLPCLPDLLGGPSARPVQGHEREIARRIFRRPRLDQILHLGSIRAQEPDPLSMTDVEFDLVGIRPFESVHPEVRS